MKLWNVRTSVIFLLMTVENTKLQRWCSLRWYKNYTKFSGNRLNVSSIQVGWTARPKTQHIYVVHFHFSPRKKMELKCSQPLSQNFQQRDINWVDTGKKKDGSDWGQDKRLSSCTHWWNTTQWISAHIAKRQNSFEESVTDFDRFSSLAKCASQLLKLDELKITTNYEFQKDYPSCHIHVNSSSPCCCSRLW